MSLENIRGLLVTMDKEKVFDSLCHLFIINALKKSFSGKFYSLRLS